MLRGLPIGQGEAWHDPSQRRLLVGLAALSFAPFLGLAIAAWRVVNMSVYYAWLAAPALGLLCAVALYASQRYPVLRQRLLIGFLVGMLGALAYDTVHLMGLAWGQWPQEAMVWCGLYPSGRDPLMTVAGYFNHWIGTAALWGMAYALVVGKAHWAYGVAYGALLWVMVAAFALLAPFHWVLLPQLSLGSLIGLLAAHLLYGAVLGAMNQQLQPETRRTGKIIFLRDYQARVKERK